MQRDSANRKSRTTIIVPVSDAKNKSVSTIQPLLRGGDGGLTKDSVGLCLQVRVVDITRMRKKLGVLQTESIVAVGDGLRQILDLEE
jgi:mRNA interferase MazF